MPSRHDRRKAVLDGFLSYVADRPGLAAHLTTLRNGARCLRTGEPPVVSYDPYVLGNSVSECACPVCRAFAGTEMLCGWMARLEEVAP